MADQRERGFRSTEFWLASFWSTKAALAVAALLATTPKTWFSGLIVVPPVCLLIYMAGRLANDYCADRFALKSKRIGPEVDDNPGRTFVFGSHVESGSHIERDEE